MSAPSLFSDTGFMKGTQREQRSRDVAAFWQKAHSARKTLWAFCQKALEQGPLVELISSQGSPFITQIAFFFCSHLIRGFKVEMEGRKSRAAMAEIEESPYCTNLDATFRLRL